MWLGKVTSSTIDEHVLELQCVYGLSCAKVQSESTQLSAACTSSLVVAACLREKHDWPVC